MVGALLLDRVATKNANLLAVSGESAKSIGRWPWHVYTAVDVD